MGHQLSTHLFNKKTGIISTFLNLIPLVGGLLFVLPAFEVQVTPTVTPKTVMYVEIDNHDFSSVGEYTLAGTNQPTSDMGIIFAANINYDTVNKEPCLYPNERARQTLNEVETQIHPVRAHDTKVLLSISDSHEGTGFANFSTYESADALAAQLGQVVSTYHLDGIDFDDEYAEHRKNGAPRPNDSSFVWLFQALRSRLDSDELVTFYNIGPTTASPSANPQMNSLIDYAQNPYYDTWNPSQVTGMPTSHLGASTVEISVDQSLAAQYAKRTKVEQYGIYLIYNLSEKDSPTHISAVARELYGRETNYSPTVPTP